MSIGHLMEEMDFPWNPGMGRLLWLIEQLWDHPNNRRVDSDWVEFVWDEKGKK